MCACCYVHVPPALIYSSSALNNLLLWNLVVCAFVLHAFSSLLFIIFIGLVTHQFRFHSIQFGCVDFSYFPFSCLDIFFFANFHMRYVIVNDLGVTVCNSTQANPSTIRATDKRRTRQAASTAISLLGFIDPNGTNFG